MAQNSETKPLIHCITNPIAMNQSANAILALGGRPIMAEHPLEVSEITETAEALLLNFGNISDTRMAAMEKSIAVANQKKIPVVLDAVGVACSKLRIEFFEKLMAENSATVIKGNYSEILAINNNYYRASGVDSEINLDINQIKSAVLAVSKYYNCIVVATGPIDYVAFGNELYTVEGGCEQMGTVTGTGCMLGAIMATFLAFENTVKSVEKACDFFKECGCKASTPKGGGTFMVNLIDRIGEYNGF